VPAGGVLLLLLLMFAATVSCVEVSTSFTMYSSFQSIHPSLCFIEIFLIAYVLKVEDIIREDLIPMNLE
jgi:hypothetical protein